MPPDLILSIVNLGLLAVNLGCLCLTASHMRMQHRELRDAFHHSFLPVIINHIHHVERICSMNADQLRELKAAAAQETAVDASVVALLTDLSAKLNAANNNSDAPNPDVQAIIDGMKANATSLAQAVAVNTPVANNPSASGSAPPASDLPPASDTPPADTGSQTPAPVGGSTPGNAASPSADTGAAGGAATGDAGTPAPAPADQGSQQPTS